MIIFNPWYDEPDNFIDKAYRWFLKITSRFRFTEGAEIKNWLNVGFKLPRKISGIPYHTLFQILFRVPLWRLPYTIRWDEYRLVQHEEMLCIDFYLRIRLTTHINPFVFHCSIFKMPRGEVYKISTRQEIEDNPMEHSTFPKYFGRSVWN